MLKVGCIGICQIHGIGRSLAHSLPDAEIGIFEASDIVAKGKEAEVVDYLQRCDIVFSHWFDQSWGVLSNDRLRARVSSLHILPVIGFTGWHPDIALLSHGDRQFLSPVGYYHSAIAATAFRLGYRPEETETLFNSLIFAELGYFEEYDTSWQLMVDYLDLFGLVPYLGLEEWRRDGPFMWTVNHPKIAILARVARAAAILAGLMGPDAPLAVPGYDRLSSYTGWPVYPEIGDRLGVPGDYRFMRPTGSPSSMPPDPAGYVPIIGLPQLIRESYAMYAAYPEEAFAGLAPVHEKLAGLMTGASSGGRRLTAAPPPPRPAERQAMQVDTDATPAQQLALARRMEADWQRLALQSPASFFGDRDAEKAGGAGAAETGMERHDTRSIVGADLHRTAQRCGVDLAGFSECFELGCGTGRDTVRFARQFRHVTATDLSSVHLDIARAALQCHAVTNVRLLHLSEAFMKLPEFDVFVSLAMLEHVPPPLIAVLLTAMLKRLRLGGVAFVRVPTYCDDYRFVTEEWLAAAMPEREVARHLIPQPVLFDILQRCGCRILECREDSGSEAFDMVSTTVLARKDGVPPAFAGKRLRLPLL